MRFLHTSDWHLGRTLHNVDLLEAQRAVLREIIELVAAPPDGVPLDAVVIAGDVYDRAVPPVEAVALFDEALAELSRLTTVVVTSGNHDSAVRLGFGSSLFAERLQVRTDLASVGSPVLIGGVAVYPLPYLDPDVARVALAGSGEAPLERSHQAVMSAALDRVRQNLATQPAGTRSVVVAHAFVVGGAASESERSIVVGGVDHVAAGTFDGIDYVALGHLHGAQRATAQSPTVLRYSGSPLRYSFSESAHEKSVTLVEVPAVGPVRATELPLRQPRAMAEVVGTLAELTSQARFDRHVEDWVRVTVTDRSRPEQLFDRVKSRFPYVLQVFHVPDGMITGPTGGPAERAALSARELGTQFVSHVTRLAPNEAELELFEQAYALAVEDAR